MPSGLWLNLVIPGAGLLLRGRLALGLGLILPALLVVSAFILAQVVATSTVLGSWRLSLLAAYGALATMAMAIHALLLRDRLVDAQAVKALFTSVAAAHLTNRPAEALAGAQRLTTLAGAEPGAWRLLASVAEAAGDKRVVAKSRRRAERLERDREG